MPDFTPLPDARPEHLHDPSITATHVTAEVKRDLVTIELTEFRVMVYKHQPGEIIEGEIVPNGKPYFVIDIDNDLETDDQPLDLKIYRNDGAVYSEGVTE